MSSKKGAIFYGSKYGSTGEYANWISQATGLPVFNIKNGQAHPQDYDFLVIGSPIIYYKIYNRKWLRKHAKTLAQKPCLFFSVSGAGPGAKLEGWIENSDIPDGLISASNHVALRGRQIPTELTWFDRMMLIIAAKSNPDPVASKEELNGFDYMDKSAIKPILGFVAQQESVEAVTPL